jgi:hypothetical protein
VRSRIPLLLAVGEVIAAALVLGMPDLAAAASFFSGGYPTVQGAVAASSVLIWAAILLAAAVVAIAEMRRLVRRTRPSRLAVGVALAIGLAVLVGGAIRHSQASYSMCCGSLNEARQQLQAGP